MSVKSLCLSSKGELPMIVGKLAVHEWDLAGIAVACCPPAVLSSPHIYPEWVFATSLAGNGRKVKDNLST